MTTWSVSKLGPQARGHESSKEMDNQEVLVWLMIIIMIPLEKVLRPNRVFRMSILLNQVEKIVGIRMMTLDALCQWMIILPVK